MAHRAGVRKNDSRADAINRLQVDGVRRARPSRAPLAKLESWFDPEQPKPVVDLLRECPERQNVSHHTPVAAMSFAARAAASACSSNFSKLRPSPGATATPTLAVTATRCRPSRSPVPNGAVNAA